MAFVQNCFADGLTGPSEDPSMFFTFVPGSSLMMAAFDAFMMNTAQAPVNLLPHLKAYLQAIKDIQKGESTQNTCKECCK
jgi:hypothetical protein